MLRHDFLVGASLNGKVVIRGEGMEGEYGLSDGVSGAAVPPRFRPCPSDVQIFLRCLLIREKEKSVCSKKNTFFPGITRCCRWGEVYNILILFINIKYDCIWHENCNM